MTPNDAPPPEPPKLAGVKVIEAALLTMPLSPGVYRMLDSKADALYVGKARSLKKRVANYTQIGRLPERLRRMVSETVSMEIITTHTEAEALLLEANLIKRLRPRYNIVLRDDKSYPWLLLAEDHPFPQVTKHRGARTRKGGYYGPFASAWAVNETVNAMQRVFLLRSCTDSVFANRSRPCLLHQIRRCSAPCVGRIGEAEYARLVDQARAFLGGKAPTVQKDLAAEMEGAAAAMEYERAAAVRDRIRALTHVQGTAGVVNPASVVDADVVAAWQAGGQTCVQVFFIRGSRNNGNRAFYPVHNRADETGDVLAAFLAQFYDDKPPPPCVLLNHPLAEMELVAEALTLKAGRRVELSVPQRGEKRAVVAHAETNAREALERKLAESAGQAKLLDSVGVLFDLPAAPERIECYDNSHIMGASPYGVMVAAGPEGFQKNSYRKYSIRGPIAPGDDFAMMREVMERRFGRAKREADAADGVPDLPDLVLIDGGAGQLSAASKILADLGLHEVRLVAIAKGPDRDAGREWFHTEGRPPFQLPPRDPSLYFLQRIRDEAHRFAITTHRSGRSKAALRSELDEIAGVGAARKRALLNHFGSARGVKQAGLVDLEAAPGINRETARRVYAHFHPGARLELAG